MTLERAGRRPSPRSASPSARRGFLVTVMRHAGVCLPRQYCAFAGIARGQKTHDFFGRLVARRYATAYVGGHGGARLSPAQQAALPGHRRARQPIPQALSVDRAVERLMMLDHVLAHRDLHWLAGRAREARVLLAARRPLRREELPSLTFGDGTETTTRYFPDKLPIGVSADRRRHVFLYLVTQEVPLDFRAFLHRHAELLRALPEWEIRLLMPRHRWPTGGPPTRRRFATNWHSPLPAVRRRRTGLVLPANCAPRPPRDGRTVPSGPAAVRRAPVSRALSSLAASGDRGAPRHRLARFWPTPWRDERGRLECRVPAHRYAHLTPLVGPA